jgi:uncharacterized iron-regulated membrane protein
MDKRGLAAVEAHHAEHRNHQNTGAPASGEYAPLDRLIGPVSQLHFAFPVLISPPMRCGGPWGAKSDSQDRVLRDQVTLDPATGAVLSRLNFSQNPLIDRVVGIGVAAHEGHLYGWLNQLVNLCTAMGLIVLCISALVLWWRRRPASVLGAPVPLANPRFTVGFAALVIALGIYLPLFGLSLVLVAATERLLFQRFPATQPWLGLGRGSI